MDGENNGIPEYPIKMDDLGGKPTIFGNIQMVKLTAVDVCFFVAKKTVWLICWGLPGSKPRNQWIFSSVLAIPMFMEETLSTFSIYYS